MEEERNHRQYSVLFTCIFGYITIIFLLKKGNVKKRDYQTSIFKKKEK